MSIARTKRNSRKRRSHRTRARMTGTAQRPRLSVFRSNTHIAVQAIDDVTGATLFSADDRDLTGTKSEIAFAVGKRAAEAAQAKKIEAVVFDRGGYLYHGRVKALADGAREGGLKF